MGGVVSYRIQVCIHELSSQRQIEGPVPAERCLERTIEQEALVPFRVGVLERAGVLNLGVVFNLCVQGRGLVRRLEKGTGCFGPCGW